MNIFEFFAQIERAQVTVTVRPNTRKLRLHGRVTEELANATAMLKEELLEFVCAECGVLDQEIAYDKDGIPFCPEHYYRIGLVECAECGRHTKLTSMHDCPLCLAEAVVMEEVRAS